MQTFINEFMSPDTNIDLAYYFDPKASKPVSWSYGQKRALLLPIKNFSFTITCLLEQTDAEWILFWDHSLGEPDMELVKTLTNSKVDAWHGGLKLGLAAQPDVLNNCEPTWIYNSDAADDVTHTSFRLSMRACLIRTSLLRKLGGLSTSYDSLTMAGLALGYRIVKGGGIIRYHADLVKEHREIEAPITQRDEWVFLREFFDKKWQLWTILNRGNKLSNYKAWRGTRGIKRNKPDACVHSSLKLQHDELPKAKVSVLVPTLDRYSYLLNELEQLNIQTVLPHEVLVTDQTDEANRIPLDFSKYENITVRYFPQNDKGQCIAWNKLLEEATGEYVLFLGDDADGIKPDFIEKLLSSAEFMESDMVASNVIELGINYDNINHHYALSTTFPITLIKRSVLLKSGFMDMFFNRNIRADHDLAMRCHFTGALMIFDPTALIHHHRAPAGGLRAHKARVVTNYMVKNSVSKFVNPTSSEIYLAKKYFGDKQVRNYVRIKYINQLTIKGNIIKRLLKLVVFVIKLPSLYSGYKKNERLALAELAKNKNNA